VADRPDEGAFATNSVHISRKKNKPLRHIGKPQTDWHKIPHRIAANMVAENNQQRQTAHQIHPQITTRTLASSPH